MRTFFDISAARIAPVVTSTLVLVMCVLLFAYNARFGRLAGWSTAGTLGTISHGLFLIFTGPIWVITGTTAAGIQSREPRLRRSVDDSWNAFRLYSRFPAGLPPSMAHRTTDSRAEDG